MFVRRVYIDGFKSLIDFTLDLDGKLNIIVGDNETGKSSVLEAIHLVLTRKYDGRSIDYALDPYLFNTDRVADYFAAIRAGGYQSPPEILIEAYLAGDCDDPGLARLSGTHNHDRVDAPGLTLVIEPNSEYTDELRAYADDQGNPEVLPTEYFHSHWRSFKGDTLTARNSPLGAKLIDTSIGRAHRGPNRYVTQLVNDDLPEDQRLMLSLAYRKLRHEFGKGQGIQSINDLLKKRQPDIHGRELTVQMDLSSRASWENAITPHLGDLPFDCIGRGQQCQVQMHVAIAGAAKARVLLVEEPENHLSHSNMARLMSEVAEKCDTGHQIVISTHSAFVLNKLGIDKLRLISRAGKVLALEGLDQATSDYFMKLPGYDTLRLLLANRCILVEGPSDELIVQKAYKEKHGTAALQQGVDIISVGTAFKRFLEIAHLLRLQVCVLVDNDGNVSRLTERFAEYLNGECETIQICYDADEECRTLEPQLVKANGLDTVNRILGKTFSTEPELLDYMQNNKTECALAFLLTDVPVSIPEYIQRGI